MPAQLVALLVVWAAVNVIIGVVGLAVYAIESAIGGPLFDRPARLSR